ncbi:hypothetical protein PF005_g23314 [Phytophthora fragariae]|uniref:Uncharacterized protein n=1 Tax=Phytophthora fragariae TaxID=53985 RepID=A0A6A3W7T9_9STRA|nr:hypothetical protein PF003_g16205 [Phytophthora fragariae]KAE8927226.1 hypothetical protein PF009_g22606 [Phytophthora fragariae]KAE8981288.1 hypothetical protein PF011_g22088 [Phytophthora fragariae]KAE9068224.1 hypothetical protein PF010_g27146 [Phytophthora fragariae]KAE9079921.1 hypothetical protein PF007_g23255 [Phytophthora fragariae]
MKRLTLSATGKPARLLNGKLLAKLSLLAFVSLGGRVLRYGGFHRRCLYNTCINTCTCKICNTTRAYETTSNKLINQITKKMRCKHGLKKRVSCAFLHAKDPEKLRSSETAPNIMILSHHIQLSR